MAKANQHTYNVVLTKHQMGILEHFAIARGVPKSTVIRDLVNALERHELQHAYCCANGQQCFVPTMHTQQAQTKTANGEPG